MIWGRLHKHQGGIVLKKQVSAVNLCFQVVLHGLLAIFQGLSYAGLALWAKYSNFYVIYARTMRISAGLFVIAGAVLAFYYWRNSRLDLAVLTAVQGAGAAYTLFYYCDFLASISTLSPVRWMLTPYLVCLVFGVAVMVVFRMKARQKQI